jgi:tetratricopeptide (TPR) repeat protein
MMLFTLAVNAGTKDLHVMGVKGMELILDLQYDEANKISDEMIKMEPEKAIGYFIKTKNNFWMCAFGNDKDEYIQKFEENAFKTIDISKKMLRKNKDNTDALLYLGNSYLYLGRSYGEKGSWVKAFWYGRKGANYLKEIIAKDPVYYDAYLGIGIYHYYLGVLPKYIKPLSFLLGLGGDKQKAIEEITIASLEGNLTKDEAKFILAQAVYLEQENNYEAALPLYEELVKKYPDNPYIKQFLIRCYRNLDKYDLAIQTINSTIQTESSGKYPTAQTLLYRYLGLTYSDINEYDKAIEAFKTALTLLESQNKTQSWEYQGALYYIGDCYEMMGEIDKAHEYYLKVSKEDKSGAYTAVQARLINPLTPAQIELTKGSNYSKCGEYNRAGEIFDSLREKELEKNPIDKAFIADLEINIGILGYRMKEYQKSIQTLQKMLASNDVNKEWVKSVAHYFLGNCYRDLGEKEKAKVEYNIAYMSDNNRVKSLVDNARREME